MQEYWLAFTAVHGLGPVRLRDLYTHFGNLETAWWAASSELRALGLPASAIEHHAQLRQTLQPLNLLTQVYATGAWVLTLADEAYPPLLREIDAAPPVLYGLGTLTPADQKAIALVGTRKASSYGKEMTRQLVTALAQQGVTIVSGLAHGIDTHAHQAALEAGGRTIAVLGCGIDVLYPTENRRLAGEITQQGAILTEFPLGTQPLPSHFPVRNRIISGLSLGTVVVEAPEKSGSINTAQYAGEQGREVFAVPGNANSPNSKGCNLLIQDGAKLVISAEDILKELKVSYQAAETRQAVKKLAPSNALEAQLVEWLTIEALHVDELSRKSNLPIQEINTTLVLMELKGLVFQVAPMTYQVVN